MRISGFLFLILLSPGCRLMNAAPATAAVINPADSSARELTQQIVTADTILLISHTGMILDKKKNKITAPRITIDNQMNREIIREQKILTGSERDTLVDILSMPKPEVDSLTSKCWDPHHAICIITKTKLSYIDLCFHCAGLAASKDLGNTGPFGELKWRRLLQFFRQLGLRYELPEKILPAG